MKNTNNINNFIYNDTDLIEIIIDDSKNKFINNGIYKDAYIIKKYISNGGTFPNSMDNNEYFKHIILFLAEKWVDVIKYLEDHHICDLEELQHSKCIRPLLRITEDTPITINELIKLHSKKKILELCYDKINNNSRINWRLCKTYKNM